MGGYRCCRGIYSHQLCNFSTYIVVLLQAITHFYKRLLFVHFPTSNRQHNNGIFNLWSPLIYDQYARYCIDRVFFHHRLSDIPYGLDSDTWWLATFEGVFFVQIIAVSKKSIKIEEAFLMQFEESKSRIGFRKICLQGL